MEDFISTYWCHHLSEDIFDILDLDSLSKCREVSRFLSNFLNVEKKRFLQVKIIRKRFGDGWNNLFRGANFETRKALQVAIKSFYKRTLCFPEEFLSVKLWQPEGITPLHVAAGTGDVRLFKIIQNKTEDTNWKNVEGMTPLHYAAENGHLEICQIILANVNKTKTNPGNWPEQITPLHLAAAKGHVEVCKLLIQKTKRKLPEATFKWINKERFKPWTPLDFAAFYGKMKTCTVLIDNSVDRDEFGTWAYSEELNKNIIIITAHHSAHKNGKLETARMLIHILKVTGYRGDAFIFNLPKDCSYSASSSCKLCNVSYQVYIEKSV